MNRKQTGLLFTGLIVLITVIGTAFYPQESLAGIAVDSYCDLVIQSMQQDVTNFQELLALANQYQNDPNTLTQEEQKKQAAFDQAKDALLASFGITDAEYATYMGQNGRSVDAYLGSNPSIKQQIDDLSSQIGSLLQDYESLKGTAEPSLPPLP